MKLFPDPLKQGDIKFIFAKKIPYGIRMKGIFVLFLLGLLCQLFLNFWLGLFLLALGTGLSLIKGYEHKPQMIGQEEWTQVTPDEYSKIKSKQKQLKKWDLDCFDITNPLGGCLFLFLGVFCFILWVSFLGNGYSTLASFWAWDAFIILTPHWLTGVKSFLKKDRLLIKIGLLEMILKYLEGPSDIQVLPMLSTKKTKSEARVPLDARLLIRALDAPKYFLGLQIQISMNNVQGKDYPYLYCVLIAEKDKSFFQDYRSLIGNVKKLTFSKSIEQDVDVLVIRQKTTRTSGYYTNKRSSQYVVDSALQLMRQLIKK